MKTLRAFLRARLSTAEMEHMAVMCCGAAVGLWIGGAFWLFLHPGAGAVYIALGFVWLWIGKAVAP